MAPIRLTVHDDHPPAEAAVVDGGLGDFNDAAAPLHEVRPLACFAHADDGAVIGGAVGRWWGGCAELQQLWVESAHRKQGLGARLVHAFEEHARAKGCTYLHLETFSFQAPAFYERLGYVTEYVRRGYPHGIAKFHMGKRTSLAPSAGGADPRPAALSMRAARADDLAHLQEIRRRAFAPVFASFRALLGDELYDLAQRREDEAQAGLLPPMLEAGSVWSVLVAECDGEVVGFVALRADAETRIGEIGLNAIDPAHAGRGLGTRMYELALERLRERGMQVATVATGGDPSHAPARRAYEKVGFAARVPSVWMVRKL